MKEFKEKISDENIGDYCTEVMKLFGGNINIARHIPLLIDSLKPVERRIIYTMYKKDCVKKFKKVASIMGSVMEMYHPHGDIPIYECIVRLAQDWNNLQPLIDKQGNFGSIVGENAASARYIEAKLSKYAYKCFFEEFNEDLVDMKKSYSGEFDEPEYLTCRYPNILINNTTGIGFGISVGIPAYNLKEAVELTIKLLEDPNYKHCMLIPDSPTGCFIIDEGHFKEICDTGKGKYKMRGKIELLEDRNCLIIRNTPFQVALTDVKDNILKLHDDKKIFGLIAIKDDTSKTNGMALRLFFKKEINLNEASEIIYKKTQMEKTFSVQFKLIDDYRDYNFNLRQLILEWINIRREQKRKIFNQILSNMKNREHILEILIFILNKDNAEQTIKIIKNSENRKEIIIKLMKRYGITSLQADTIAEMKMSAFTKEAYKRYVEEKTELSKKIEKIEKIIKKPKKIDEFIIDDLKECIQLFSEPRRSQIISKASLDDIKDTKHLLVFTRNGFVKKLPHDVESIGFIGNNDHPLNIIQVSNVDDLLVFDSMGKVSRLSVHTIQNHSTEAEGDKLNKYCNVSEDIISIIPQPTEDGLKEIKLPVYFLFITKNGLIKKTVADKYTSIKSDVCSILLKSKDKLISTLLLVNERDIFIYTKKGLGIRFSSAEIKDTGRVSQGLVALVMDNSDQVIGADTINGKDKYILMLTQKGICKKCKLDYFKQMQRNVQPLKLFNIDDDDDLVLSKLVKGDEKFKIYSKNGIYDLLVADVPELPRLSRGKKMLSLGKGNYIIDIIEDKS
jgi:DNA gyrase subunit A